MGNLGPKTAVSGLMPDVHFLPVPVPVPLPVRLPVVRRRRHLSDYVEGLLADPESGIPPAAGMVLEVVQGEGGSIPAPDGWLRDVRRITRERGIPLILDEIQTGLGPHRARCTPSSTPASCRTCWCCRRRSAAACRWRWWCTTRTWTPGRRGRTPARSAATSWPWPPGWRRCEFIREHDLPAHAAPDGRPAAGPVGRMQRRHPFLGDVRGRGLMVGVEVVDPDAPGHLRPAAARRRRAPGGSRGVLQARADRGARRPARQRAAVPAAAGHHRGGSRRRRRARVAEACDAVARRAVTATETPPPCRPRSPRPPSRSSGDHASTLAALVLEPELADRSGPSCCPAATGSTRPSAPVEASK